MNSVGRAGHRVGKELSDLSVNTLRSFMQCKYTTMTGYFEFMSTATVKDLLKSARRN